MYLNNQTPLNHSEAQNIAMNQFLSKNQYSMNNYLEFQGQFPDQTIDFFESCNAKGECVTATGEPAKILSKGHVAALILTVLLGAVVYFITAYLKS